MKKIVALLIALGLVVTLASCKKNPDNGNDDKDDTTIVTPAPGKDGTSVELPAVPLD